jgi:hypothetical protein
MDFDEEG